jgi:hypothetical protein
VSRHTIKLHSVVIGWSDLDHADAFAGKASGKFRPGAGYDLVQPVFQLYTEAVAPGGDVRDRDKLERYHKSRDKLGLTLEDDEGRLVPTSVIHIADYSSAKGGISVEVLITDREYWKRRASA